MPTQVIEYPTAGATYNHDEYGVYEYGVYEPWSVLAGQEKRSFLGSYPTLEEAQQNYPDAVWSGEGSGYREIHISESPPEWFDPEIAGERWEEDY